MTRPSLTIGYIIQRVAEYHGTTAVQLRSDRRSQRYTRPRHIAMWLAAELLGASAGQIGAQFNDRDTSSVAHAIRRINQLRKTDLALAGVTDLLREALLAETARPRSDLEMARDAGAGLAQAFQTLVARLAQTNPRKALETFQRWHDELEEMT